MVEEGGEVRGFIAQKDVEELRWQEARCVLCQARIGFVWHRKDLLPSIDLWCCYCREFRDIALDQVLKETSQTLIKEKARCAFKPRSKDKSRSGGGASPAAPKGTRKSGKTSPSARVVTGFAENASAGDPGRTSKGKGRGGRS